MPVGDFFQDACTKELAELNTYADNLIMPGML